MAGTNRKSDINIKEKLLANGRSFSFFQVMRLLKRLSDHNGTNKESTDVDVERIKVQPNLSLDFPISDVEEVEESERGKYTVTVNMLGLYGTCSPLPTFYTEDLLDDVSSGNRTAKDFIDVINHRLYELLFAAWGKYRGMVKVVEENNRGHINRLFSIIGLGEEELRKEFQNPLGLLKYTGLFALNTRSASGLETMLSDALNGVEINIIQGVERKGQIPEDQRCCLNGESISLGINSYLGQEVKDKTGSFRIEIGPVSEKEYRLFLPGEKEHELLVSLTDLYVSSPLDYDLEVILDENTKTATACLGSEKWSKLGLDTWIFSDEGPKEFRPRFCPEKKAA